MGRRTDWIAMTCATMLLGGAPAILQTPPTAQDVVITVAPGETSLIQYAGDDVDGDLVGFFRTSDLSNPASGTLLESCVCVGTYAGTICTCTTFFAAAADFAGSVTFTYRAVDATGLESADATVTINSTVQTRTPEQILDEIEFIIDRGTSLEGQIDPNMGVSLLAHVEKVSAAIGKGDAQEALRAAGALRNALISRLEHGISVDAATPLLELTRTLRMTLIREDGGNLPPQGRDILTELEAQVEAVLAEVDLAKATSLKLFRASSFTLTASVDAINKAAALASQELGELLSSKRRSLNEVRDRALGDADSMAQAGVGKKDILHAKDLIRELGGVAADAADDKVAVASVCVLIERKLATGLVIAKQDAETQIDNALKQGTHAAEKVEDKKLRDRVKKKIEKTARRAKDDVNLAKAKADAVANDANAKKEDREQATRTAEQSMTEAATKAEQTIDLIVAKPCDLLITLSRVEGIVLPADPIGQIFPDDSVTATVDYLTSDPPVNFTYRFVAQAGNVILEGSDTDQDEVSPSQIQLGPVIRPDLVPKDKLPIHVTTTIQVDVDAIDKAQCIDFDRRRVEIGFGFNERGELIDFSPEKVLFPTG